MWIYAFFPSFIIYLQIHPKMRHFPFSILLVFIFPQFCHGCSPTLSQTPPTTPSPPCCSPLNLIHFSGHTHLYAEYNPPQKGSSKCHSNVQIECSSLKISNKKIELAIFDDFGHFLANGKGKINTKGICEKSDGKWKWKFGQNWAEEIGCIWRKKKPKNGDKSSKWSSEENEDRTGKMAQKIAIFLMHDQKDAL